MDNKILTRFAKMLALQAEMFAITIQVKGMEAENQLRTHADVGQAYGRPDFRQKAEEMEAIAVRLREI